MFGEDAVLSHVAAYGRQRDLYSSFAQNLDHLLKSILNGHSVKVHVIEARAKTLESFKEKINRAGKSYSDPLKELSDLCGCRIITYYADDVAKIAELLSDEFEILEEELSHQPAGLEVDRFGYLSAHYVIKLKPDRGELTEWKAFADLHAEVQIRTVIQHAWSAVSHEMQYKQETGVPSILQRRLYRIAGLFELADEEFVGIRDQKLDINQKAAVQVASGHLSIPLSFSTIAEAVKQWTYINLVRGEADRVGFIVPGNPDHEKSDGQESIVPDIYRLAEKADIKSVRELIESVEPPKVSLFDSIWDEKEDKSGWTVSDDFLFYLLMLERFRKHTSVEELIKAGWSESIAQRVITGIDRLKESGTDSSEIIENRE